MRPIVLPVIALLSAAPVLASSLPPGVGMANASHDIELGGQSDTTPGLGSFAIASPGLSGRAAIGTSPTAFVRAYATNTHPTGSVDTNVQLIYDFAVVAPDLAAAQALQTYLDTSLSQYSVIEGGNVVGNRAGVMLSGYYDTATTGTGFASVDMQAGDEVGFTSSCYLYQSCSTGNFMALGRLDYTDPLTFTGYVYLSAEASSSSYAGQAAGYGRAFIDPLVSLNLGSDFTGNASDYTLVFSPGVVNATGTGAVPEPAEWALLLLGFGCLGLAMRQRATIGI